MPWLNISPGIKIIILCKIYYLDKCTFKQDYPAQDPDDLWKVIEERWYMVPKKYISHISEALGGQTAKLIAAQCFNASK